MTLHPVFITVAVTDAVCLLMMAAAVINALKVTALWNPGSSESVQIDLEAGLETAGIQVRFAFWVFTFSTLFYVSGIAMILPASVSGAMCGTGVLQAMDGKGQASLAVRFTAFALLYWRHVVGNMNRSLPTSPLAVLQSRLLMAVFPVVCLAVVYTFDAMLSLEPSRTVDCCAVVYDTVRGADDGGGVFSVVMDGAFPLSVCLGMVVSCFSLVIRLGKKEKTLRWAAAALALSASLWVPFAAVWTVTGLSAYHFQVLHHHCPWCLLLPDHRFAGFPIFIALAMVFLEGAAAFITLRMASLAPGLEKFSLNRCRKAGLRVLISLLVFCIAAVSPAIVWRVRYGVWM